MSCLIKGVLLLVSRLENLLSASPSSALIYFFFCLNSRTLWDLINVPNSYSVAFPLPRLYQNPGFFVAHILSHCKAAFHNLSYFTSRILNQIIEAHTLTYSFTLDKVFKRSYESPVFYWVPSSGGVVKLEYFLAVGE